MKSWTAVGSGHDANGRREAGSERRIHFGASGRQKTGEMFRSQATSSERRIHCAASGRGGLGGALEMTTLQN